MNNTNRKIIQESVREAGDYLKGKLPEVPEHTERNSYAHLWRSIKQKMGATYSECADSQLGEILDIVAWHRKHKA